MHRHASVDMASYRTVCVKEECEDGGRGGQG